MLRYIPVFSEVTGREETNWIRRTSCPTRKEITMTIVVVIAVITAIAAEIIGG